MISIGRRLLVLAVTVSVMGAVSGCGGSSSASAGSGPGSTAASTKAASTPAGGDAQQFCGVVKQQKTVLQGTGVASLLTGGSTAAWKTYLDQVTTMNQQLVDAAPPEIQASVKTLQDGTLELKSALAAAGYDVSKVGSAKLIQLMQTPERTAATSALVDYVKAQCGIDLTSLGG